MHSGVTSLCCTRSGTERLSLSSRCRCACKTALYPSVSLEGFGNSSEQLFLKAPTYIHYLLNLWLCLNSDTLMDSIGQKIPTFVLHRATSNVLHQMRCLQGQSIQCATLTVAHSMFCIKCVAFKHQMRCLQGQAASWCMGEGCFPAAPASKWRGWVRCVTGAVSRRAVRASARRRRSGVEPLFSLLPFILFRYAAHCILFSKCSLLNG